MTTTQSWRSWLPDQPDTDSELSELDEQPGEVFVDTDDPISEIAADMRRRSDLAATRRKMVRAGIGAAAALALVGGGVVMLTGHSGSPAAAPAPKPAAATKTAAPWCAETHSPTLVVGNGQGKAPGTPGVTGPDLILFQQYQWYVARNADAARTVLSADAVAADPDQARAAVAAVPAHTQHCVSITTLAPDRFDVQIEERRPDGTAPRWQQTVTTGQQDGHTVITAITAGGQ
ncbi:hypothetical protein [Nocardia sp. NPDC006630]|uniref:hypothetical protein n=1 Tax=Nocardia sp. NPDC006630 TaxID=3157181 RepID=UPI0033A6D215